MSDTTHSVKRRNGSKHDKTGCLTCRYRRKKCIPNTFPVCGACRRLNLECVREPTRQVLPSSTASSIQSQPQILWRSWLPKNSRSKDDSSRRRHAMSFYISVLSQLLTVSEQHNSFVSAFLPMAMDSSALLHALVSWASGHLSTLDKSYRVTALEARSESLRALVNTIQSDEITCRETNAATSLVLLTSEVCLGDYTKWYSHLVGIKNLIMSSQCSTSTGAKLCGPGSLKQSPEGRWILRNFAYHDVLGGVMLGRQSLIHADYLHDITDVVDTYIGVATEILAIISETGTAGPVSLAQGYLSRSEAENTETEITFLAIENKLHDWSCPDGTAPALTELAYAYRAAALIFLYRRTYRALALHTTIVPHNDAYHDLSSRIQKQVASVLEHVARISENDSPESALLFPLFLAGAEAVDNKHIDMIRTRMELLVEKRPFQNILRAMEVLEEIWVQRQAGIITDWQDVVDRQEGGLLLT